MKGFTLVEVLVAMALLAVAAAGMAGLATVSRRAAADARSDDVAARAAASKLAALRGLAFAVDVDTGTTVTDSSTNLTIDPPSAGGPGLSLSPTGTLTTSTGGYVDYVTSAGAYAGTGLTPPRTAAFVRRWSVSAAGAIGAAGATTLVLQVAVSRIGASAPDVRVLSLLARAGR